MANNTNTKRIEKLEADMVNLNSKIDQLIALMSNNNASTKTARGSAKKEAEKADYETIATAKENKEKVYKAMDADGVKYKGADFNRNTYKKYAKKLGVWSDKYNRVVGTYKTK